MREAYTLAARAGRDIQGFRWDELTITREEYRLHSLGANRMSENFEKFREASDGGCQPIDKGGRFFEFFHNTASVKPECKLHHLRNMIWATSKHDVYLVSKSSVMHWSSLHEELIEVFNFSGHIVPTERYPGSLLEGFINVDVTTVTVKDRFLVAGGYRGELICKSLDKPGVSFCAYTTDPEVQNTVTNAIDIYDTSSGLRFMTCNNDGGVREFDMARFQLLKNFSFPWPVKHTSMRPDHATLIVVGDDHNGLLVDARNWKTVGSIAGHGGFYFTSAWHRDGWTFATGNEDTTCRVWDMRNLVEPIAVLGGNLGSIRSVQFSADGQFLLMAEAADFVHVYSTLEDFRRRQEIDLFGDIAGVALCPDDESLYIGVCGTYHEGFGNLIQFNRKRSYGYLDSFV